MITFTMLVRCHKCGHVGELNTFSPVPRESLDGINEYAIVKSLTCPKCNHYERESDEYYE